jgi:multiple sugar transport system substrate-binding protein
MKRIATAAATALLVMVGVSACGGTSGGGDSSKAGTPAAKKPAKLDPATITLWVGFTQRELRVFKDTVKGFESANPGVKVRVVGGINDDKIIAASRGGKAPDVAQSFTADNSGAFCGSGRLGRPQALPAARRHQGHDLPARPALLHPIQGHALRAADAR